MAFKEGHRRWDRMVAKRELEEIDEAAELWNYLRGKASKIDFSDLSDGELNLIAAGVFREQQRRELGETYEPPGPSRSPSRARKWSNWDKWHMQSTSQLNSVMTSRMPFTKSPGHMFANGVQRCLARLSGARELFTT